MVFIAKTIEAVDADFDRTDIEWSEGVFVLNQDPELPYESRVYSVRRPPHLIEE